MAGLLEQILNTGQLPKLETEVTLENKSLVKLSVTLIATALIIFLIKKIV